MSFKMTVGFEEQMMNSDLRIGDFIGDTNRMVIAYTKKGDRIPGDSYANWVAICAKHGEYHPYVVWYVNATPRGFSATTGDYCFTLEEALEVYKNRGGE